MLRQVEGVQHVTHTALGDGIHSFEVGTQRDRDPREEIFKRFAKHDGWTLRRLDLAAASSRIISSMSYCAMRNNRASHDALGMD